MAKLWDQTKSRWTEFKMPEDGDDSVLEAVDGEVQYVTAPAEGGPLDAQFSPDSEPHRVLKVRHGDYMKGEDVRALQVAAKKRLGARDIDRPIRVDGVFGQHTAEALDTAAWALGAQMDTVNAGTFSVGAQRMVRYPGTRTTDQLVIARDRMEQLLKDRSRKPKPQPGGGGTGRTDANRVEARRIALDAFRLAQQHAWQVHYTQGASRWQGLSQHMKAYLGQYPKYADCSSMYTWALWNAYDHFGWPDNINGTAWTAGYTGTLLAHGVHVSAGQLLPGDAVIYGSGWPGHHVSMYAGNGMCYSHGSEAGPFYIRYNYRGDIMGFRRYI